MKRGEGLEKYVQSVFSQLLNLKDEGIVVGQDVVLKDKFGLPHQIDVYYQFEKARITHKVAIECKDWATAVDNGEVVKFFSNVRDIGNIQPVMVAKSGFQRLAKDYAEKHDIILLTTEELPNLVQLLGKRLGSVALPDENSMGTPFWTIYESRNGRVTGSPLNDPKRNNEYTAVVFYSKKQAELYLENEVHYPAEFCVRGLEQHQLRAFVILCIAMESKVRIYRTMPNSSDNKFMYTEVTPKYLGDEYYHGEIPEVKTRSDYGLT